VQYSCPGFILLGWVNRESQRYDVWTILTPRDDIRTPGNEGHDVLTA